MATLHILGDGMYTDMGSFSLYFEDDRVLPIDLDLRMPVPGVGGFVEPESVLIVGLSEEFDATEFSLSTVFVIAAVAGVGGVVGVAGVGGVVVMVSGGTVPMCSVGVVLSSIVLLLRTTLVLFSMLLSMVSTPRPVVGSSKLGNPILSSNSSRSRSSVSSNPGTVDAGAEMCKWGNSFKSSASSMIRSTLCLPEEVKADVSAGEVERIRGGEGTAKESGKVSEGY